MKSLIASLYAGYALYLVFPYTAYVESFGTTPDIRFALNVLIYVVAYSISYFAFRSFLGNGFSRWRWPEGLLALLALAFLIALLYHAFGLASIVTLPSTLTAWFIPKAYFFWWFIAPLAGLLILG